MKRLMVLRTACAAAGVVSAFAAQRADALDVYALTVQGVLVRFDSATPGTVTTIGAISGTNGSATAWRGIDFRPATGTLYLLQAGGGAAGADRLYTVNTSNAAATLVSDMNLAISGSPLGIDFNPSVDLMRVVTSSTNNYRVNPTTGVVTTDTPATLSPAGNTPFISGSAYTNGGFFAPLGGATTLYNIDSRNSSLTIQNPANGGVNTEVGVLGVALGNQEIGFDIFYNGAVNSPFLAGIPAAGGTSSFYTVNLTSGAATLVGAIGGGVAIRDISVIPAPGAGALLGLGWCVLARRRRSV